MRQLVGSSKVGLDTSSVCRVGGTYVSRSVLSLDGSSTACAPFSDTSFVSGSKLILAGFRYIVGCVRILSGRGGSFVGRKY